MNNTPKSSDIKGNSFAIERFRSVSSSNQSANTTSTSSESSPTFRSMAMPHGRLHQTNQQSTPLMKIGSGAPYPFDNSQKVGSSQQQNDRTRSTAWDMLEFPLPALRSLGQYYPLSRQSVQFPRDEMQLVLKRLEQLFYEASISVIYETTPVIRATCYTLDQVHFVVQFWQHPSEPNQVWMECDLVSGDTLAYHSHYSKLILRTATNDDEVHQPAMASQSSCCGSKEPTTADQLVEKVDRLIRSVAHLPAIVSTDDDESPVQSALEISLRLLQSDRYDAQRLGLQGLTVLTDVSKTSLDTASAVAQAVVCGSSAGINCHAMQQRLLTWAFWNDEEAMHDEPCTDIGWKRYHSEHANLAFTVLAQSLMVLQRCHISAEPGLQADVTNFVNTAEHVLTGETSSPSEKPSAWLTGLLLQKIHAAKVQPHVAYWATHILGTLCDVLPPIRDDVRRYHLATVQEAQQVGCCGHAALERASGSLLATLS